jgi:predicted Zn-dependent protease
LLAIQRAVETFDAGMKIFQAGDPAGALERLKLASAMHPDDPQIHFWTGVVSLNAGREHEALAALRRAYAADPGWLQLLLRLVPSGLVPDDPELVEKLEKIGDG